MHFSEWDAEWPGPQVIIEVSEKAPNTNGTGAEGNARNWWTLSHSMPNLLEWHRDIFQFLIHFDSWFSFLFNWTIQFIAGSKVIVRTEEVLIVLAVLVLWVGAIALFFNRWGKIRMLEPYQPKFQQQHRSSCPLVEIDPLPPLKHPSFSRCSMGVSLPTRMGSISGPSGSFDRPNSYPVRGINYIKRVSFFFEQLSENQI